MLFQISSVLAVANSANVDQHANSIAKATSEDGHASSPVFLAAIVMLASSGINIDAYCHGNVLNKTVQWKITTTEPVIHHITK